MGINLKYANLFDIVEVIHTEPLREIQQLKISDRKSNETQMIRFIGTITRVKPWLLFQMTHYLLSYVWTYRIAEICAFYTYFRISTNIICSNQSWVENNCRNCNEKMNGTNNEHSIEYHLHEYYLTLLMKEWAHEARKLKLWKLLTQLFTIFFWMEKLSCVFLHTINCRYVMRMGIQIWNKKSMSSNNSAPVFV